MFAGVVPVTVEIVILDPEQGRVRHRLADILALKVESGDMLVEPGSQPRLVPKLEIAPAVRQKAIRNPIRMRLQRR